MKTTKEKFDEIIHGLLGDKSLPEGVDIDEIRARMASYYKDVIAKVPKSEDEGDEELRFFMTFLAGYLSGYCDNSLHHGKNPWVMPYERN